MEREGIAGAHHTTGPHYLLLSSESSMPLLSEFLSVSVLFFRRFLPAKWHPDLKRKLMESMKAGY